MSTPRGQLIRRTTRLMAALVRAHPLLFLLSLTGAAGYGVAVLGTSVALGRVVDDVVVPRFDHGRALTGGALGAVLVLVVVAAVKTATTLLRRSMSAVFRAAADATLRARVVRHYQALPYAYHQTRPTGELLARASSDPEAVVDMAVKVPLAGGLVVLFAATAVWSLLTDPVLALVGMLVVPAIVGVNAVYQRRSEAPAAAVQERTGRLAATAHESFDAALTVKVLGGQQAEEARFSEAARGLKEAKVRGFGLEATFDAFLEGVPAVAVIALLVVGAVRVDAGDVTVGTLVGFVNLFTLLTFPLRIFGYVFGGVPRALAAYERVRQVLDEPPAPAPGEAHLADGPAELRVTGLSFGHVPGVPVLHDVDLTVPPGTTLAVVGGTGSGKSTLLLLLAGLHPADAGELRLGGTDLRHLDPWVRSRACTLVLQEAFLFADSVEENVTLGLPAGTDAVRSALDQAAALGFVDDLPDGLATVVGERGVTLSGGQRQRIALARALLRSPRLLLLDDATSAVDPTTEASILRRLASRDPARITVVVASRPATLALAGRVLYLERGRVRGLGTHEELLRDVPGYADLVQAYENERMGSPA